MRKRRKKKDAQKDGRVNFHDANKFVQGQIVRIRVQNWVTFVDAKMDGINGLNFVVAPNGSGKSSIVSAICIGLGGKPSALGKTGSRIVDFIKRGHDKAMIEITLHRAIEMSNGVWHDATIKRVIKRKEDGSQQITTTLNGRPIKQAQLQKFKERINLKVENPCQFLSQDRVSVFAGLTDKERLMETMKAIGQGKLHESYEKLIELDKEKRKLDEQKAVGDKYVEKERKKKRCDDRDG